MRLQFLGGSYKGRSTSIDSQECVNFYTEISSSPEAKEQLSLIGTPGKRLFLDLAYGVIRGQYVTANGRWFAVSGNKLYEIFYDKRYTEIGKLKSNSGAVSFSENETQMILVDGIAGYLYYLKNFYNADGTVLHAKGAFEQITTPEYVTGTVVITKDRYFIQNIPETGRFIYSRLGDGSHWTPDDLDPVLNEYTVEGSPDNLLTIGKVNNDIWLFGSKTIEIWSNTGLADSPFARVGSAFMDIGISAPKSFGVLNNTAIWLGGNAQGNGIVWTATGYIPKRVSTHAIEYVIGQIPDISDATAWVYQTEGHYFYVLNFGKGQKTICYDMSTDMWHERGFLNVKTGFNGRDLAETQVFFGGQNYVSDYRSAKIYKLDLDYYYDDETNIKRIRTGGHIHDDRRRIFFHKFELDVQRGVGINPVGHLTKDNNVEVITPTPIPPTPPPPVVTCDFHLMYTYEEEEQVWPPLADYYGGDMYLYSDSTGATSWLWEVVNTQTSATVATYTTEDAVVPYATIPAISYLYGYTFRLTINGGAATLISPTIIQQFPP